MIIQEIKNLEDFKKTEDVWNDFHSRNESHSPFLTYEFFFNWWKNFGKSVDVLILVMSDKGRIQGITPLIKRKADFLGENYFYLSAMQNNHTPFFDIVAGKEMDEVIKCLLDYMEQNKIIHIDFDALPQSSQFLNRAHSIVGHRKNYSLFSGEESFSSPFIDVNETWEAYWNARSRELTRAVKRKEKKIAKLGELKFSVISEAENIEAIINDCFRLESLAWKGDAGTAVISKENIKNFYFDYLKTAYKNNWLRIYLLELNNRKIAFEIAIEFRDEIFAMKIGYDPEFVKYSPGILLRKNTLEYIFKTGRITRYDFLGPFYEWKQLWTKKCPLYYRLVIFRNDIKSLSVSSKVLGFGIIWKMILKGIIKKAGIYNFLKKLRKIIIKKEDIKRIKKTKKSLHER
ncbi:MAG: GNAT family N-acetyltransferase [Candidatus Omnitrophota bacterium]